MFAPDRGARGFTITELIVATAVLSTFMMLALGVVMPGIKVSKQAEEDLASQRQVVLAFDRLFAEMSLMDRASVSHSDGNLSFLSNKPFAGGGAEVPDTSLEVLSMGSPKVWTKHVLLHLKDRTIWRREFNYLKGNQIARIMPDKLDILGNAVDVPQRAFVNDVEAFVVDSVGRSRIAVKLRSTNRHAGKPESCEVTMQVGMRGGL